MAPARGDFVSSTTLWWRSWSRSATSRMVASFLAEPQVAADAEADLGQRFEVRLA